jgi:hypothetical protein
MDYKPNDFLVGVIDFFAILLPGAMLAFVFKDLALNHVFGTFLPSITGEAQGWAAFLISSYLLGHFLHFAGSYLDTSLYDRYRAKVLTGDGRGRVFECANKIKMEHVQNNPDAGAVNTFKWARASVQLRYPAAATEIHRLEADSKFFRSLIVVLCLFSIALIYKMAWAQVAGCLVLMGLSFVRYADQRFKSTDLAYTYLIVLDAMQKSGLSADREALAKAQGN